ncbi:hypothetical protein CASFOL_028370 [Castilleja foliolosa]|uniref:Uncharacterized protein n=1 Tax=Castilleja foliolosa TaxID=1961234 RepID=A0ABD3CBS1_9LAMI
MDSADSTATQAHQGCPGVRARADEVTRSQAIIPHIDP